MTTELEAPARRPVRLRVVLAVLALAAVVTAIAVVVSTRGGSRPVAVPPPSTVPPLAPTTTTTVPLPAAPAGSTLVGAVKGSTPASVNAGGPPVGTVPATWYGYPTILPVLDVVPGWALVRLAQRPNESTAWVPLSDLTISSTPYRIVIDLATEHLTLLKSGVQVASFPAGIGSPDDPTVTGNFFMAMKVPPPSSGYGPFVLVTSAHSDSITDWEGSGDAIIAIHGPIDASADAEIGTTGAAISHGCVRLHDSDLAQLGGVPAGSPIDIVAG